MRYGLFRKVFYQVVTLTFVTRTCIRINTSIIPNLIKLFLHMGIKFVTRLPYNKHTHYRWSPLWLYLYGFLVLFLLNTNAPQQKHCATGVDFVVVFIAQLSFLFILYYITSRGSFINLKSEKTTLKFIVFKFLFVYVYV